MSSQAERISVIRQIAAQTASLGGANTAQNTVTVQIHPAHWGQVTVSVSLLPAQTSSTSGANAEGNSAVTATLITADPAVRDALQAHTEDLSRALNSAGFHVDKVEVAVQATMASSGGQGMSGFHQGQTGSGGGFAPDPSGLSTHANGGGSHQSASFGSSAGQEQGNGQDTFYSPNGPLGQDDVGVNAPAPPQNPVAKGRVDYRI